MSGRTFIIREEIAAIVGVNAAILHERLKFMVEQNYRENRNQFEGKSWVAGTYEDWTDYIPMFSVKQIRTAFEKLKEAELVVTGSFNRQNTDRKLWYALSDEAQYLGSPDLPKRANASAQKGKSGSALEGRSACAQKGRSYKDTETLRNSLDCAEAHTQDFKEFWEVYPRPKDREESQELFREAVVAGADPKHIIFSAKAYASENEGNGKAYLKHSTNWLEAKSWEDFDPPPDQPDRKSLIEKMKASPNPTVRAQAEKMEGMAAE